MIGSAANPRRAGERGSRRSRLRDRPLMTRGVVSVFGVSFCTPRERIVATEMLATAFNTDILDLGAGDWIVELACGHHVRTKA